MVSLSEIILVEKVDGVEEYILVDEKGSILSQKIKDPDKMAVFASACLTNALAIAKTRLKYLSFSRKNKNNIYIFPVGKFSLGVVKHHAVNEMIFIQKIIQFLNDLIHR